MRHVRRRLELQPAERGKFGESSTLPPWCVSRMAHQVYGLRSRANARALHAEPPASVFSSSAPRALTSRSEPGLLAHSRTQAGLSTRPTPSSCRRTRRGTHDGRRQRRARAEENGETGERGNGGTVAKPSRCDGPQYPSLPVFSLAGSYMYCAASVPHVTLGA